MTSPVERYLRRMLLHGPSDYFLLGTLLVLNIIFWKRMPAKFGCALTFLGYGVVFPLFSMSLELARVEANGGWMDGFEVLYTWLCFPAYWLAGILQSFALRYRQQRADFDDPNVLDADEVSRTSDS